jgi:hypothetical protein
MLELLFCLIMSFVPAQSGAPKFYVDQTVVYTDYGSIYILKLANKIVPPDELHSESDVACLIEEVKKSGMFINVQAEIVQGDRNDMRVLTITANPEPRLQSLTLSNVELVGFPKVDIASFKQALDNHDVRPGGLLAKYSLGELMDRVNLALEDTSQNGGHKSDTEIPWITVSPSGPGSVKLIVSPQYSGCCDK